ncbi:MAG: hypothetical protein WD670_06930 [Actinomycetota bacterium]
MSPHLEPVPDQPEGELDPFGEDQDGDAYELIERPPWWRLVAILVVVAMVVATPFAYALYTVFH